MDLTQQEADFTKRLADLVRQAKGQGMCVSMEQVHETFPDFADDTKKLSYICGYLTESRITIGGEADFDSLLTAEDKDYLAAYLKEIKGFDRMAKEQKESILKKAAGGDKEAQAAVLQMFLPTAAEIAKTYAGQGAYLADLIGEGNLALAEGVCRLEQAGSVQEAEGFLGKQMMEAMERYIGELLEEEEFDKNLAERVNKVAEASEELAQELLRKVTPEELSQETGMTEGEIEEVIRMSGRRMEHIDLQEED